MNHQRLIRILEEVQRGVMTPQSAAQRLETLPFEDLDFAKIDHHRSLRRGYPEVVYGAGKTAEQMIDIAESLLRQNAPVLITRLAPEKWEKMQSHLPALTYSEIARCASAPASGDPLPYPGHSIVCAAGTSDLPVSEEAAITLETMGHTVNRITDIGVAGLHRLLSYLEPLRAADVIVAVAGMEGALPSVIAGLVDCPVIGVPTSVGYSTAFGGVTPLLSMLNSCATGVTVVNIDNGFGAGYAAGLMLRRIARSTRG